jgi:hypothetical protein
MKRVQCRCGKILALPDNRREGKFRCPQCKVVLRLRSSESTSSASDDYRVVAEPGDPSPAVTDELPASPVWIPATDRVQASKGRTNAATILHPTKPKPDDTLEPDDFPGPFLDRSALLFPWLYPTWACGIGLAIMTELTVCAIGATAFFLFVIMSGMAFGSLFTFASMVMVCVGLTSYVFATFEMVLEQTAHGDNRLRRLPGYVWYELLPPLKRVFGASASALAIAVAITYSCRQWLGEWYDWPVLIVTDLISFVLFPIFMISNSVEQSFLPIWGLFATLTRLARCFIYFAIFLVVAGVAWAAIGVALQLLSLIHVALAVVVAGPLLTIWLLYYGHWLGRVVRQMMALDC